MELLSKDRNFATLLPDLDQSTGEAVANPKVLAGIWDESEGEVKQVEGDKVHDITDRIRETQESIGLELYWLKSENDPERERNGRGKESK